MDPKKLEQKLSEVADWVYPSVSLDNATERVIPSNGNKEYKAVFTPKPDMGPRIVSFKKDICLKPCDWCNKIVNQQTYHRRVTNAKGALVGWHHECTTCQKIYNPKTGELLHKNAKKAKEQAKKIAWYNDPNYKG